MFKGISALISGILKRKGGRCTAHYKADSSNTELLFRTIHSANQLSIYGAVSSWCEELAQWIPGQNELTSEKSVAKENEQLLNNEAARSEVFGANSKKQRWGIWKEIARTTSEMWNTGERNPFYESL